MNDPVEDIKKAMKAILEKPTTPSPTIHHPNCRVFHPNCKSVWECTCGGVLYPG